MGQDEEADECMEISMELATGKKTYPLELFAIDRIKNYKEQRAADQNYMKDLLILELFFLWNTLVTMKGQMKQVEFFPFVHISYLPPFQEQDVLVPS